MGEPVLVDAYRKEAQRWLAEGCVTDVEFAGRTYQVQVIEPAGEEFWPFLQFGADEEVQDAFCTCDRAEQTGACLHLATALLALYRGHALPLHVRYRRALWNQLCTLFGRSQGYETQVLTKQGVGRYVLESVTGKQLFSIEGRTEEVATWLEALIERRIPETEENSLKFSGLSPDELTAWRQGTPSEALQYELSFWSDLAKRLMWHQEQGNPYEIHFQYGTDQLPRRLHAKFGPLSVSFYLSRANLALLIPALNTVESPLSVHHTQDETVRNITYDRESGSLHIGEHQTREQARQFRRETWHQQHEEGHIVLDGWLFVPGEGFYAGEKHDLVQDPVIEAQEVGRFLDLHAETVRKHLVGETVHMTRLPLRHELWFDREQQLHIRPYLLSPGDLQSGSSRRFAGWVYLHDDGFHPVLPSLVDQSEMRIPKEQVSAFVHRNRIFLGEQPGFSAHLSPIESALDYTVNERGTLVFSGGTLSVNGGEEGFDFGDWLYVPGQGFFAKEPRQSRSAVRAGVRISADKVPLFIRANREELAFVSGFFSETSPVQDVGLEITLLADYRLHIAPQYTFYPEVAADQVQRFGDYTYVPGEGFSEVPRALLPPERFRTAQTLEGKELQLFLTYELDRLLPKLGSLDHRLKRPEKLQLMVRDAEGAAKMPGSASLKFSYRSETGTISVADLWLAQAKRQRYVFTEAGLLDLHEDRFHWLHSIHPNCFDRTRNTLHLTTMELVRLQAATPIECAPDAPVAQDLFAKFATYRAAEAPSLKGLKSDLRPYQKSGLHWLWFLHSQALSGLLCDDMGLGKTHQAMALMAAIGNTYCDQKEGERPHYLVICPTSVLYHWRDKLEQYLPGVRVHLFHGPTRVFKDPDDYDVLLTSYGVYRSEQNRVAQIHFVLVVFDEIQVAKNPASRTHRALTRLHASMRLGLTGTPVENNLRDLRALFELVLPGYFPSDKQFRSQFSIPIEREGDAKVRERLRNLVRPFILRRKKEEVLTELPDKTEEKAHCELSPEQASLYHQVLVSSQRELLTELRDRSRSISYTHIFSVLTSLKRICDHPAVYLKQPAEYKRHHSEKWILFCELLNQARDSKQKVVVFSQYLDMIEIIEHYLKDRGIGYACIRGSTTDREQQLTRFANEPHCEVFVGSLGAAGLGIELTAASVVIHYDRWWTKARENQATDRVYRIGQTRGVQVFKLLTVGTLEERIDAIIERKGQLMEEIVGVDDAGQLKSFSREELIALLADLHEPTHVDSFHGVETGSESLGSQRSLGID